RVAIVVARGARDPDHFRLGTQEPARVPLAGEDAIDPTKRFDADEIAQDEHVEWDLQLQLRLDLRGRVRGLARLVVLDDPAGAKGIEIDPVDLAREREGAEIETALELLWRALGAEGNLEPPRHELQLGGGFVSHERLEIAQQALLELAPLQVGQLHPDARHRLRKTFTEELERLVEVVRPELLDAEAFRDASEELVQRAVRDLAAEARVDNLVDRARADQAVDEPDRRAVGERLQLGDAEVRLRAQFLEHERVRQAGRAFEGA